MHLETRLSTLNNKAHGFMKSGTLCRAHTTQRKAQQPWITGACSCPEWARWGANRQHSSLSAQGPVWPRKPPAWEWRGVPVLNACCRWAMQCHTDVAQQSHGHADWCRSCSSIPRWAMPEHCWRSGCLSRNVAAGSVDCCAVAYPSPNPDWVTAAVCNLEESGEPNHRSLNSSCFLTTSVTSSPRRAKLSSGITEDLHDEGSLCIRNAGHWMNWVHNQDNRCTFISWQTHLLSA